MKDGMNILRKRLDELFEKSPEIKEQWEKDDNYIDERIEFYRYNGYEEMDSKIKAWNDYWKMAYKRDGVEFSIHKLDGIKETFYKKRSG